MTKKQHLTLFLSIIILAVFGLFSMISTTVFAGGDDGLPPRPPTPTPTATPTSPSTTNEGGIIILHVANPPTDLQTTVQWRDGSGSWHNVEGWRGTLNAANFIPWWVAPSDLGKGPFRWHVTSYSTGIEVTSDSFTLPWKNETVHVYINLAQ